MLKVSPLENGIVYKYQKYAKTGTAYFSDWDYLISGNVIYDGHLFANIQLMYDVADGLLVTSNDNGKSMYSLIHSKIISFEINKLQFVNLSLPEGSNLRKGFYQLLYDGELKVFSITKKTFKEKLDRTTLLTSYSTDNRYYLKIRDDFYEISRESAFLNLFKEGKKEIKKFLKENDIRFNENPAKAIVAMASFYDSLKK